MPVIVEDTWLEINSIPLATPAWLITDLSPLLDSASVRGQDRLLPGAAGVRPLLRRRTVTRLTFPVVIFGDVDQDGATIADPRMGMVTNKEYLETNLGIGLTVDDGTVPAIWHRRNATTKTADVHVLGFHGSRTLGEFTLRTTLDISIPAGRFT